MSLNPYGKFWSSAQEFSTAIEFYARALMKFLWKSAQFFPVLSNMPSKIQSKNVDFCCAIFSCVC